MPDADPDKSKQMTITFDPDTFREVTDYATHQKISFGAAVRELVEFGLIEVKING